MRRVGGDSWGRSVLVEERGGRRKGMRRERTEVLYTQV